MAEEDIIGDAQPIPPTNSISIYKEDSTEDFPVLKAFQQYLDAEQSKARKRMVGLCAFFVILMVIVIGVFLVMLHNVQERNQALNDRLLTLVVSDRQKPAATPAPMVVPAPQPAANAAELRAITDTLKVLKTEIADRRTDEIKQAAEAARQAAVAAKAAAEQVKAVKETSPQQQQPVSAANGTSDFSSPVRSRKLQTEQERLDRERARLIEERTKLQLERERFRQEEIERQRRKLYPEYYRRLDENKKAAEQSRPADVRPAVNTDRKRASAQVVKKQTVDDGPAMKRDPKTGAITYFEPEDEELNNLVKDLPRTKSRAPVETERRENTPETKSAVKQVEKLITETQRRPAAPTNTPSRVKVEINGKAADWLIPIQ